MTALLLFLTVLVLAGLLVWLETVHAKERRQLVNTLIARTPGEVRMLNNDPPTPVKLTEAQKESLEYWSEFEPVGI